MKRIAYLLHSSRRCESGATAIEFSIVGFVMILAMLGIFEFGRGLLVRNEIAYLADMGSRRVMIDPDIADDALQENMRAAFLRDRKLLEIEVSTETVDEMQYRKISVAYPINFIVPGLSSRTLSLSVTRRVPIG